jgi:hypothetical protein
MKLKLYPWHGFSLRKEQCYVKINSLVRNLIVVYLHFENKALEAISMKPLRSVDRGEGNVIPKHFLLAFRQA